MVARPRVLVFLTALSCLTFELVVSRIADFHLGASNSYLALPITFLGLALGSLHVHFDPGLIERFRVSRAATALAVVSFLSLMTALVGFGQLMPPISELSMAHHKVYYAYKTVAFIAVMVAPFYVFGRVLTTVYAQHREHIGSIYSADFFGAALACALTPTLFHFTSLPIVGVVLLALTFLPTLVFGDLHLRLGRAGALATLLIVCLAGAGLVAWSDGHLDYSRYRQGFKVREVRHRWNEFSRVALLELQDRSTGTDFFKIVHDNARSNVHVWKYKPERVGRAPTTLKALEAAFLLGRPIHDVLAMFAGCGAEMIVLDQLAGGKARITGVELNPLVKRLALQSPELSHLQLSTFHARPNIDLVAEEGRHFLSTHSRSYDLIFVGSNAATGVLTGHSRKYLDTEEAFGLYLDRLKPHGVLVFDRQPIVRRLTTLYSLFEHRGLGPLREHLLIVDGRHNNDVLVVSPAGFSSAELGRVVEVGETKGPHVLYAPTGRHRSRRYDALIRGERQHAYPPLVDDRPFLIGLGLGAYSLVPDPERTRHYEGYLNWAKITTLIVLCVLALAFLSAALTRRATRPPPSVLVYLLVTGFCFMLVEIALIAKLELFLQQPIISMATVLSIFLLTSGVGSAFSKRIEARLDAAALALAAAALATLTGLALDSMNAHLLAWPIAGKLALASLAMAPTGIALGIFYPYAIACLLHNGRERSVPITYGISTLASVVGATYGMTLMIDQGFSALLRQASVGYLGLGLCVALYTRVGRRPHLSLRG